MNATVQVLRAVPELHTALGNFQGRGDMNKDLIASMRDLYIDMGKTTEGLPPIRFLQILRQVEPRFAEVRQGAYAQQGTYSNSASNDDNPNAHYQTPMNAGFKY
jgi:ubiquitin carboxyl-terminal hydrolase 14